MKIGIALGERVATRAAFFHSANLARVLSLVAYASLLMAAVIFPGGCATELLLNSQPRVWQRDISKPEEGFTDGKSLVLSYKVEGEGLRWSSISLNSPHWKRLEEHPSSYYDAPLKVRKEGEVGAGMEEVQIRSAPSFINTIQELHEWLRKNASPDPISVYFFRAFPTSFFVLRRGQEQEVKIFSIPKPFFPQLSSFVKKATLLPFAILLDVLLTPLILLMILFGGGIGY